MRFSVWLAESETPPITSQLYQKFKDRNGIWWHRGVRGQFDIMTPDKLAAYEKAMQMYTFWYNNEWMHGNESPEIKQALKTVRELGRMAKGQDFSDAVQDVSQFGTNVFSIKLPKNIYLSYMTPGISTRMAAGGKITIPGTILSKLVKIYPNEINDIDTAHQKFSPTTVVH